jgi:ribonucleotide reductase beta subunit family protein with ferritin-like domain
MATTSEKKFFFCALVKSMPQESSTQTPVFLTLDKVLGKDQNTDRYNLHPIQFPSIMEKYNQAVACFWTVHEVDLSHDVVDFAKFTEDERHFILKILSFFATAEGIVNENLATNFVAEVHIPEAIEFFTFQMAMESIHHNMYGILLTTYEKDHVRVKQLTHGVRDDNSIKAKSDWARRWMTEGQPFLQRIIAFACVEGIFFSASFCAIFWLKKQGRMPGLTFSNELISRDEGLHRDFALFLYNAIEETVEDEIIYEIVKSAVECEIMFVRSALHGRKLLGMSEEMMVAYVKHVANNLLNNLNLDSLYDVEQPFEWMELISISGKTNFFEKRVGDYQKAFVMQDEAQREFSLDGDF